MPRAPAVKHDVLGMLQTGRPGERHHKVGLTRDCRPASGNKLKLPDAVGGLDLAPAAKEVVRRRIRTLRARERAVRTQLARCRAAREGHGQACRER